MDKKLPLTATDFKISIEGRKMPFPQKRRSKWERRDSNRDSSQQQQLQSDLVHEDLDKLVVVDFAVLVEVRFLNHAVDLLVAYFFTNFPHGGLATN